jgi:hypothetical protein
MASPLRVPRSPGLSLRWPVGSSNRTSSCAGGGERGRFARTIREPSLSDRNWLEKVRDHLTCDVRALEPCRPLYYILGDETGIADLSASWDFDFSQASLTAMWHWLKERYELDQALSRVGLRV